MGGDDGQSGSAAFRIFAKDASATNRVLGRYDCVCAGPDASTMSQKDQARLKQRGWSISPDTTGFARDT